MLHVLAKVRKPSNRRPWPQRGHLLRAATLKIQPVVFGAGAMLQPRALPALFLLHQLVQELMSKGLMRYLVAYLGGLFAVARGHRENFPVHRVGPCVSPAIDFDVDGVAGHREALLP